MNKEGKRKINERMNKIITERRKKTNKVIVGEKRQAMKKQGKKKKKDERFSRSLPFEKYPSIFLLTVAFSFKHTQNPINTPPKYEKLLRICLRIIEYCREINKYKFHKSKKN